MRVEPILSWDSSACVSDRGVGWCARARGVSAAQCWHDIAFESFGGRGLARFCVCMVCVFRFLLELGALVHAGARFLCVVYALIFCSMSARAERTSWSSFRGFGGGLRERGLTPTVCASDVTLQQIISMR